jgi:hypothetical protein
MIDSMFAEIILGDVNMDDEGYFRVRIEVRSHVDD